MLCGYIPYTLAMELVDCSGEHVAYGNDVKIIINKPRPKWIEDKAGPKPLSTILENRPEGGLPCTQQILLLLEDGSMERAALREKMRKLGYASETIRGTLWKMRFAGRIVCEGSPNSPKQKISKAK